MGQRKCPPPPYTHTYPSLWMETVTQHHTWIIIYLFDFYHYTSRPVQNILHWWTRYVCLHHGPVSGLDSLSVFFLSLSQPGKVENWLRVIWRRSYLLLTVEWHHNGAAGVQLPFSPPPSVLSSASTPALADKLRLMTQISREPVYLPISHARALVWETLMATARRQCMWISLTCSPIQCNQASVTKY